MTESEKEVKERVEAVFTMRNIAEMSRRTGYRHETLRRWKKDPYRMKAVDLFTLERILKIKREGKK